jgi:hypothetical protein
MRLTMSVVITALTLAVAVHAAQDGRLSRADMNGIAGRWIGTVKANVGEMPIALNLKAGEPEMTGSLETGHGNWTVVSVRKKSADWVIEIKTPDGLAGTMTGQIKEGRLRGDWNFKPRAVGTFDVTRPAGGKK